MEARSLPVRRAFVTGGAGFVGSHVVQFLLAAGVEVRTLVRRAVPTTSLLAGLEVELVSGDLTEVGSWADRLRGCEVLFHLAAAYSPRPEDASQLYAVNVGGTQALLRAAAEAGVARVIHTSTIGTIGRPPGKGLPTESTPFNLWTTGSDYVRSKWLGEAAALWWNRRGLPVVVVHPTAPVGPGDWKPTATGQRLVDFLARRRPDYPAGGMNLCPVRDIAAGHLLAASLARPGQRYILGHAEGNLNEERFLSLLAQVSGLPVPATRSRARGRRPGALTADPARAIAELGLPQSDLPQAFREAIQWSMANSQWSTVNRPLTVDH